MRILAVDDDPVSLELLEVLVEQIGSHTIECADLAAAALSLIGTSATTQFDCILLDIEMPAVNGIELCELIRSTSAYLDTPILMVTRMGEKSHIDDAFKAGATDYLSKPFEINELRGRLNIISKAPANRSRTGKIFCAKDLKQGGSKPSDFGLHSPIIISDIDGLIEYTALENYVSQLSRNSLFGSSVFALKILGIAKVFESVSRFEFQGLIADVAEAISHCLKENQALMAYSGNGTYVCVADSGWRPDLKQLVHHIELCLANMDLHLNGGTPITAYLCAGRPVRLLSRKGTRAIDALCEAQDGAEAASAKMEQSPLGMCLGQRSA